MTVFDSVLLDVYRTRLYLPLLILGAVFWLSPGFRAGVGRVLDVFSDLNTVSMAALMFVVTLVLAILVCYDGKSWGGDFSQYFAQTRALADHTVAEWYEKNIFIIETSAEGIGSDVYPWFWSVLLLPMYRLFGFHIPLLKLYEAVYFAAAMIPLVFLLRRRINGKRSIIICLCVACNLTFLMNVNTIESDLPSLFITLLILNLMDLYHRDGGKLSVKLVQGILLGVMIFAACETRTMNQALLLALAAYDVIVITASLLSAKKESLHHPGTQNRRSRKLLGKGMAMGMPFVSYAAAAQVFYAFLPKSGGTYNDYFEFTIGRLQENTAGYFEILGAMVCAVSRPVIAVISYTVLSALLVLAAVGMFVRWREERYLIIYMGGMMCMLLFYDYMDSRFVFTIYPLILLFACHGYVWLRERFADSRLAGKGILLVKDACLLYMTILFVSFCTVAVSVGTGRYSLRQADSVWAQEFYAYVNDNVSDEAVIYFFKPRVLYLYTNVYSYNCYNETEYMDAADYIAVCAEDGYDRVHAYAKEHGTAVFENEMFSLYEMPWIREHLSQ